MKAPSRRYMRLPWALIPLFLWGCAKGKVETRGQLMLAVTTDLQPPKDFDRIRVQVLSFGSTQFDNEYKVDKGDLTLPATLGLMVGRDPSEPATIRVTASLGKRVRMVREILTTVPEHRVARLTVPIEWLCLDQVETADDGTAVSSCGDGRTCVGGQCVTTEVDSSSLPDFTTEDVFGGGDGSGNGSCFDTVGCFASGYGTEVDLEACTIALGSNTEGDQVSVALVRPPESDGICGPEACLIPLDRDVGTEGGGWSEKNGEISLPKAVCDRLQTGDILGVAVTTACQPKTSSVPTCGEWSSVSTEGGTSDAGGPEMGGAGGEAGSSAQAGKSEEAGSSGSSEAGSSGESASGGVGGTAGTAGSQQSSGSAGEVVTASEGGDGGSAGANSMGGATDACGEGSGIVALFHFDGTDGSTNLTDSSGTGKVSTIYGNPAISTAQSKFGGSSLYINGDGNAQTNYVTVQGDADFTFDGDFTMDWWQYAVAYTDTWGGFVTVTPSDVGMSWNSSGTGYHFDPYYPDSSIPAAEIDAWHHVAITRSSTTYRGFIDGVPAFEIDGNLPVEQLVGDTLYLTALNANGDNGDFNGYIDELRVVKGCAAWTGDFEPPTVPYQDSKTTGGGGSGGEAGAAGASSAGGASQGGSAGASATDACSQTASLSGGTSHCVSSGQGVSADGQSWTMWSSGTGACMTTYSVPGFSASWQNSGDVLARLGLNWGTSGKPFDQYGSIVAEFNEIKTGTGGPYSYIGAYGWSQNPCVEYYIVDDSYNSPINPGGSAIYQGSVTIDGGTYDLYTLDVVGSGTLACASVSNWTQYYSVRQQARTCGQITISEHFQAWSTYGMTLGNLSEASVFVEAGGGIGSVDFTYATVTAENN